MSQFANDQNVISELINRVMNCRELQTLYIHGECNEELDGLYPAIKQLMFFTAEDMRGKIAYFHLNGSCDQTLIEQVCQNSEADILVYEPEEENLPENLKNYFGDGYDLLKFSSLKGKLYLAGQTFCIPNELTVPDAFKVLAVVHFFNEEDVLAKTIEHLLQQRVDIYLLDNWSTDHSYSIAKEYQTRHPNRIYLEQFPTSGGSENYIWYDQLERTEQISKKLQYDWFIHYDADEIRISPWKNVDLRTMLYYIDSQGYNGIENTVIDFRLTAHNEGDIFAKDTYFEFRHQLKWINHLKTWKKTEDIDLKKTGGHHAQYPAPRLYPLKVLNRHYPMRSIEQASRKVFRDRKPRFVKEQGTRGWHGHYERYQEDKDLLFDRNQLILWGSETFHDLYIPLFTECGLWWEQRSPRIRTQIHQERLVIYGAGIIGREAYLYYAIDNSIVAWVDKQFRFYPSTYCQKISCVESLGEMDFDKIVIAVKNPSMQDEIMKELINMDIPREKIVSLELSETV